MRNKIETDIWISELLYKHLRGEISADEQEMLNSWVNNEENKDFFLSLKNSDRLYEGMIREQYQDTEAQFRKLERTIKKKQRVRLWPWLSGIAAILIIGVGAMFLLKQQQTENGEAMLTPTLAWEDQTILQTTEGKVIYIDDTVKTVAARIPRRQPLVSMVQTPVPVVKYNVLATSSHGQIEMMLSDSSRVWLNAGSELRYPDVFGKDHRMVYLKGEAYFEVVKNPERPFIVNVGETKIEVLGTQFDVKTLGADACRTTLVEGCVQVQWAEQPSVVLSPNQQAEVCQDGTIEVQEVDVRYQVAWKKNQFAFRDQTLFRVMQELSEWYDFTFDFENIYLANLTYTAIIPRFTTIDEVLQILQRIGDFSYTVGENKHIRIQEK